MFNFERFTDAPHPLIEDWTQYRLFLSFLFFFQEKFEAKGDFMWGIIFQSLSEYKITIPITCPVDRADIVPLKLKFGNKIVMGIKVHHLVFAFTTHGHESRPL